MRAIHLNWLTEIELMRDPGPLVVNIIVNLLL